MTIQFTAGGPPSPEKLLGNWIPSFDRAALAASEPLDLSAGYHLSDTYAVRYVALDRLNSNDLADTIHVTWWRSIVSLEGRALGEIEFDETLDPVAFHEGSATSGLIDALDVAEQLRGRYEAAVLHAPALRFIGLWLKGRADEWVVPYPPNGTRLRNQETVSPGDVIGVLREMAGVIRNAANTGHARGN